MNLTDIAILLALVTAVAFALRHILKTRRRGCSGCCCECGRACSASHRENKS